MKKSDLKCAHKVPVFGCKGCIHKRGAVYVYTSEQIWDEAEEKARIMFGELNKLSKPPVKLSAAIDEFYEVVCCLVEELPAEN